MKKHVLIIAALLLLSVESKAVVFPATSGTTAIWYENGYETSSGYNTDFGMHCFYGSCPGDYTSMYSITGADPDPYIYIHGKSMYDDAYADGFQPMFQPTMINAQISYQWKITRTDGEASSELVPVHIHSQGHFSAAASVGIDDDFRESFREATGKTIVHAPNPTLQAAIGVQLVGNGYNECYGAGGFWAECTLGDELFTSWRIDDDYNGTIDSSYYSRSGDFSNNIDLLVRPGTTNSVLMVAGGLYEPGEPYRIYQIGDVAWEFYIDPIITIDPAYADRYTLEVSYIPDVPLLVPEPESYLLLLTGLGVIFSFARRNNQLS